MEFPYENFVQSEQDTLVNLFDLYLTKNHRSRKLLLEGIDVGGMHSPRDFEKKFLKYLRDEMYKNKSPDLIKYIDRIDDLVQNINGLDTSKASFMGIFNNLSLLEDLIIKKNNWPNRGRLIYQIRSFKYNSFVCIRYPSIWFGDEKGLISNAPKLSMSDESLISLKENIYRERDSLMALNFIYLSEVLYPNEKIILRASALHINKNSRELIGQPNNIYFNKCMGNYLSEKYKNEYLSIPVLVDGGLLGIQHPLSMEDINSGKITLDDTSKKYHILMTSC